MKAALLIGLVAVLTITGTWATLAQPASSQPLAWDAMHKEVICFASQTNALTMFSVTNVSVNEVTILDVQTSCGCSKAVIPVKPWVLKPGDSGRIEVTTDVRGKRGVLVKSVIVNSSAGLRVLTSKLTIQEPMTAEETRKRNQELAKVDRQAVFKGECAKCHAEPVKEKLGKELFVVACGICHEAEHRASMVPDLKTLKKPSTPDFWRQIITQGKPDSLMPAFAKTVAGPLTQAQIESLVEYLVLAGTQPGSGPKP